MKEITYGWGAGFALIMGIVILAVILYTIVKVRKQAQRAEAAEKKAAAKNLDKNSTKAVKKKDNR